MPSAQVLPPFESFMDVDGNPLEDGYIYIGSDSLDPEANPISAFFDAGLTVPAVQPVRTKGGYPSNSGSPARLYVGPSSYSIRVKNKNGTTVHSSLNILSPTDSSSIAFIQAGSGAVERDAQGKMRETWHASDYGILGDGSDEHSKIQSFVTAGAGRELRFTMTAGGGIYGSDGPIRLFANTRIVSDPGVEFKRLGTTESWMFVNGEIGNTTYATAYNGDGNIHIIGNTFDLNGLPGVRTAAAFVLGHSRGIRIQGNTFKNGYNSHNIEINANSDGFILDNIFKDQVYDNITQSFEAINVDYASAAGFPGFGVWDNTPDKNLVIKNNTFRNVQGGVSSHSVPVGGVHSNLKIEGNTFEDIGGRAVRAQGWNNCIIINNTFINIGQEAINILTGSGNIVTGNIILGASTSANGLHSAIRIEGDENIVKDNIIKDGGYANKFPYSYGIASGSRNKVGTKGASVGTSGLYSDSGTLTSIDNRTLLFSGTASGAATVINLADSLNNYVNVEVSTGAVGSGLYQTAICRPFAERNWAVGTDRVALTTASGRFVATVTTLTSLTISISADAARHIYGVSE